jgi:hypothetical protein
MEYIILLICFAGFAIYYSVRRGRTTVRAAMYLMYMEEGDSVEIANNAIRGTGYAYAAKHPTEIIRYASEPFGGSQLKMIAAARQKGFRE